MKDDILKIYGISQSSDLKKFLLVLQILQDNQLYSEYCEKCYECYTDAEYNWCIPCQMNDLKNNFTNWTSGNKEIDNYIQKMQLKINNPQNIVFEWIPYSQFDEIKEIGTLQKPVT